MERLRQDDTPLIGPYAVQGGLDEEQERRRTPEEKFRAQVRRPWRGRAAHGPGPRATRGGRSRPPGRRGRGCPAAVRAGLRTRERGGRGGCSAPVRDPVGPCTAPAGGAGRPGRSPCPNPSYGRSGRPSPTRWRGPMRGVRPARVCPRRPYSPAWTDRCRPVPGPTGLLAAPRPPPADSPEAPDTAPAARPCRSATAAPPPSDPPSRTSAGGHRPGPRGGVSPCG